MSEIMHLAVKKVKTAIINVSLFLKKVEKNLIMRKRKKMDNIKKAQMEFLEIKKMFKMKRLHHSISSYHYPIHSRSRIHYIKLHNTGNRSTYTVKR